MTTTLATLRQTLSRYLGDWLTVSTTTNITTNTSIISTSLNMFRNDYFNDNWFVLITSGNNAGTKRLISDFVQTTGTITIYGANLLAEAGAVTLELHRFDTDEIKAAINEASASPEVYPLLAVHSFIPNDHFDFWSQTTYPNYWRVSVVTAVKESSTVHNGVAAAKVTRAGTDGYLYTSTELTSSVLGNDIYNALMSLIGQKVKFSRWVKTSTVLQARLCIYCGSDTGYSKYSNYHTGGGSWELLEVEFDIPLGAGQVGFRCEVNTANGDVYFDGPGRADIAPIPGFSYLSSLSADTDAIELDTGQAEALACMAASIFLRRFARPGSKEDQDRYKQNAAELYTEAKGLITRAGIEPPSRKVKFGWQEF